MLNVFGQPFSLLIAAAITLFVVLILRKIFPEKHHWRRWLLPVSLAVAAFGLDFLVQTNTEKIKAVIKTATKAVEEENPDVIETLISANYRDSHHRTKEDFMYNCRTKLAGPLVEKNITRIGSIDIQGQTANAIFTVRTVFDKRGFMYDFKRLMLTKVKIDLQKETDKSWLINRVEILEIDMRPANWKDIKVSG